ncbi:MAG: 16S rRNA (cytosine(967)-C(5))-methyltransferase RsmB [Phascolarctobacterium sp.]|nr:16S rRNA (cytosine(967)-C(5))-methyltransferase RsmB [Phascolarctobacterium sp.]
MPIKNKHVSARQAAVEILLQVLKEGAYTNIAINKYLRSHEMTDLDRRLLTELVYGSIKALGTIDWYLTQCVTRPLAKIDAPILNILRLSVYQILYMDKIPEAAAVNEAVKLARIYSHEGSAKFVNGVLRGFLRNKDGLVFPSEAEDEAGYLALKLLHPRWLVKKWIQQFGREATEKLCAFNNTPAPVCLRVNTLVADREALMGNLKEAGAEVHASKWSKDGIVCDRLPALNDVFAKLKHDFYIQDESSMLVAEILAPQPGEKVVDMCSAPGGKTTHIAQVMGDQGEIFAGDIHEHKVKLIEENASRLGITIIKAQQRDASVFDEFLAGKADRVLVDAPCSGLGVLRRRAEARWRKTRADIRPLPKLQLEILENGARYVKQTGLLVYSTCTIEPSENHYVIAAFLEKHPDWEYAGVKHPLSGEILDELQLLPQVDGIDGFFICALKHK